VTPNIVSKATAPLPILSLACEAAQRLGASGVVIMPEGPLEWELVRPVCAGGVLVFVASSSPRQMESIRKAGLEPIEVEPSEAAIAERISLALIEAVANDQLKAGVRVVVVYSGFEAEALDSLTVVRLGEHLERLTARDLRALETWVPFETLKAVVDTAVEIGREGREGKAVGSLIIVGDARNVLARTRPLGFDPFKGYRRKERNVRDPRVREAIKEIAQMDGAFVVARDGTVEAACRLIDAPTMGLTLPKGLGTRHWAAAAITAVTKALAVVVSQSNGTVRLFQDGEIILRIAPMRHARAMKWQDAETEPAPASLRAERERDRDRDKDKDRDREKDRDKEKDKEKPALAKGADSIPPVPSRTS
jgi:diadenylate cyclase